MPSVEDALREDTPPRPSSRGVEGQRILVGSPVTVREAVDELLGRSGADELMAMTNVHGLADRKRSASRPTTRARSPRPLGACSPTPGRVAACGCSGSGCR